MNLLFIFNSIALGVGLAMDAFSVSLANGLREPSMNLKRMLVIAGTFAFFQTVMPLAGWVCVHTVVTYFSLFEKAIPWIALGLLGWIGGSMLKEGLQQDPEEELSEVGGGTLVMQGIATSIDALSVGFTIAEYDALHALSASLIIGAVTLAICLAGLKIGRQFGLKLAGKASILGGVILIAIGLEIFLTGIL
jgi:putative Mn2+ efflux pump MntP